MRYLKLLSISLAALFFTWSAFAQDDIIVNSDKDLNADFEEIETYYWSTHALNEETEFTLNDALMKSELREAINQEMDAKGYELSKENPDVILNFRVFEKPTDFKGYENVYMDENYWSSMELRKDMIGIKPLAEIRTTDNAREYNLKEGTLLVDFVSTNDHTLVWQGYVSGVMDDNFWNEGDADINRAVELIFDEYQFDAF